MNYQALTFWFSVGQWVVMIALTIYVWLSNRQRVTLGTIDQVRTAVFEGIDANHVRIDHNRDRIIVLEQQLKVAPTSHEVSGLGLQIAALDGDMRALREELKGVHGSIKPFVEGMRRIEDYLMKDAKR